MSDPCQQVTTTWGQVLIFISFLINVFFQRRDKMTLEKKQEESVEKVITTTRKALEEQTAAIARNAKSRISDLGKQFDNLLTEDRRKRRKDD